MNGVVYLNISGLLYISLVLITFFCKKRTDNLEQRIYKYLIIDSFFELAIGLLTTFYMYYSKNVMVMMILTKIYFVTILLWIAIFTQYIYGLDKLRINKIFVLIGLIISSLILILPLNPVITDTGVSANGISLYALYIGTFLYDFICIYYGLKSLKKDEGFNKKLIPLWIFLIVGSVVSLIQIKYPEMFLLVPLEVFVTTLMYFTIENPDVKMLNEVNLAKDQAEQANAAKTEFLSSMSHEIRTPLNAIVGFSSVIENADNLEEAKENAKDIIEASNTLLEIVNGILDISKIEAGKLELVLTDYKPYELLNGCASLISIKMQEKGLDFQVNIAKDIPQVLYGDHSNIKKVIVNLLSNAYKYTDQGFVKFNVSSVINKNVCRLMITVEDSGRGIKKDQIDKLFTKFQRLDEDRNTTIEGTGLGLAITKQLVEMMGGKIVCQSVYGSGSKFTIALDQKITSLVDNTESITTNIVEAPINLKDKKILIVDDNKLNIKVAERLIKEFNPVIESVESGFECIDKITEGNKYDLILMDDMMPKMSGTETLKRLLDLKGFNMPVVALTANAISGMREQYIDAGFIDYLSKPIEKEELKRVFKDILIKEIPRTKVDFGKLPDDIYEIDEASIEELVPKEKEEVIEEPKEEEVVKTEVIKYDLDLLRNSGIDVDHGIELLGDEETYKETLNDFYDGVRDRVRKLKDLYKSLDMANYAIEVHALKSDSKYLGFMTLADIAYEHEMKSKENDSEFVKQNFVNLMNEYKNIVMIIQKYITNQK